MSYFFEIWDDKTGSYFPFYATNAASTYEAVFNDIVDADRAVDGTLKYEAIARKAKINATWNYMDNPTYQKLISLTSLRTFRMRYYSPATGGPRVSNFYMGSDLKVEQLGQWKGDYFVGQKVSASFVEV